MATTSASDVDLRRAYATLHEEVLGAPPQEGGRALSGAQYDRARRNHLARTKTASRVGVAVWPPTSQTLMKQLGGGSWTRAMTALGLTTATGRPPGSGTFDDVAYRVAVADFLAAVADPVEVSTTTESFAGLATWLAERKAEGRNVPSAAAVRKHFGSWSEARRVAHPVTMP